MRSVYQFLAVSALGLALASGAAVAQDHHDDQNHQDQNHHDDQDHHDHYVHHDDWKKGHHMRHEDWDRGQRVADWRAHHLHQPPAGYEWRWIDGQYVCANHDGVIFQVTIGH
jgi:Ni/Co efflux regulator RcnB